jgi:3D (Asp-Asp-Asp) domain-containing protein
MKKLNVVILLIISIIPIKLVEGAVNNIIHTNKIFDTVTVTTYKVNEFSNNGDITASGIKLTKNNPRRLKIIAVSRDLKKKFRFGDSVIVSGTGTHDGIYVVHDLMNKRWKKRIDILINPKDRHTKFYNIKLYKI